MFSLTVLDRVADALDVPGFNWKGLIYSFSVGQFLITTWLQCRQLKAIHTAYDRLSAEMRSLVDQETYEKSVKYTSANLKFGIVRSFYRLVVGLSLYHWNFLPKTWDLSRDLVQSYSPWAATGIILPSVLLLMIYALLEQIISLPVSIYDTFVLEERYGFNKTTPKTFVMDLLKSSALFFVIGGPLFAALIAIAARFGRALVGYTTLVILGFQALMIVLFPKVILPLFYKFTSLEDKKLYDAISVLANRLKFPMGNIYIMDASQRSSHSNAFFIGLPLCTKNIMLYDTMVKDFAVDEIVAVMAHEIGHWAHLHLPMSMVLTTGILMLNLVFLAVILDNRSLSASLGFTEPLPIVAALIVFGECLTPFEFVTTFINNSLTRRNEYDADKFAVKQGYATELSRALVKLARSNLSEYVADKIYSNYKYSHPILPERLAAINAEEAALARKKK